MARHHRTNRNRASLTVEGAAPRALSGVELRAAKDSASRLAHAFAKVALSDPKGRRRLLVVVFGAIQQSGPLAPG